jgi:hypothetical protein
VQNPVWNSKSADLRVLGFDFSARHQPPLLRQAGFSLAAGSFLEYTTFLEYARRYAKGAVRCFLLDRREAYFGHQFAEVLHLMQGLELAVGD